MIVSIKPVLKSSTWLKSSVRSQMKQVTQGLNRYGLSHGFESRSINPTDNVFCLFVCFCQWAILGINRDQLLSTMKTSRSDIIGLIVS